MGPIPRGGQFSLGGDHSEEEAEPVTWGVVGKALHWPILAQPLTLPGPHPKGPLRVHWDPRP